ncbi:hypothetical protein [Arthrobacter sp. A2-55]|uniref:hypothetical protein n=1 Tax=Arthrobacter sp. A2-55 TaxID=2897337 RepID=UPI0021CD21ED|nr:hypothetical protein [Arthrobacter sp. A2-55]MCU6479091.1 hypothetical protein [Arthrobacter sp. A2-55]
MTKTPIVRILSVLLLLGTLAFGFSPAASAATTSHAPASTSAQLPAKQLIGEGGAGAPSVCETSASPGAERSNLLPVSRWADATTSIQSRLDNTMFGVSFPKLQRDLGIAGGLSAGNFMWSLGTQMSSFAINFCILDQMGGAADGVGATIGKAVIGSPLLAALVLISIIVLLFKGRKNGRMPWKQMAAKGLVVALLAVMVAGATASQGGGKSNNPNDMMSTSNTAAYQPGVMSPGWIVKTLNNTVSSLASAPATALAMAGDNGGAISASNPLSCDNYLIALKQGYLSMYQSGTTSMSASIPMVMSSMWEGTGLQTWRTAQFGTTNLDNGAWCRLLEWNAASRTVGVTPETDKADYASTVRGIMYRAMGAKAMELDYNTKAFSPTDNTTRDRSLVAWAACQLRSPSSDPSQEISWQVNATFDRGDKDQKIKTSNCVQWFTQPGDTLGNFDWDSNGDKVQARATTNDIKSSMDVRNFIMTLHGNNNVMGMTGVYAYVMCALAMLIVFGLIALAVIVAKVALVVMIIGAFFMVILCLLPNAGFEKMGGFLKMLLGINIFVFGIQLIFALISVLTKMLQQMGASFLGGPGSLISIVWAGLAPLIAVFLIHMMFTKVLKLPSPFKLSGGLAWGAAAGAAGGAAVMGAGALLDRGSRRAGSRAMNAAKGAGRRGFGAAMSAATGGRFGNVSGQSTRRGAAAPVGSETKTTTGKDVAAQAMQGGRRGKAAPAGGFGAGPSDGTGEAATFGTEHLLQSGTANSQVGRGKMSAHDRQLQMAAAKEERELAKEWDKSRRAELGLSPVVSPLERLKAAPGQVANGTRKALDTVKATASDIKSRPVAGTLAAAGTAGGALARGGWKAATAMRYSNAAQQFRQRPLRTTAKVAAGGLLLASLAPAPLVAGGIVAGAWAAKKAINGVNGATPSEARRRSDERVNNYRTATMHRRAAEDRARKEAQAAADRAAAQESPAKASPVQEAPAHVAAAEQEPSTIKPGLPQAPQSPVVSRKHATPRHTAPASNITGRPASRINDGTPGRTTPSSPNPQGASNK